jgi:hypothetical protein
LSGEKKYHINCGNGPVDKEPVQPSLTSSPSWKAGSISSPKTAETEFCKQAAYDFFVCKITGKVLIGQELTVSASQVWRDGFFGRGGLTYLIVYLKTSSSLTIN